MRWSSYKTDCSLRSRCHTDCSLSGAVLKPGGVSTAAVRRWGEFHVLNITGPVESCSSLCSFTSTCLHFFGVRRECFKSSICVIPHIYDPMGMFYSDERSSFFWKQNISWLMVNSVKTMHFICQFCKSNLDFVIRLSIGPYISEFWVIQAWILVNALLRSPILRATHSPGFGELFGAKLKSLFTCSSRAFPSVLPSSEQNFAICTTVFAAVTLRSCAQKSSGFMKAASVRLFLQDRSRPSIKLPAFF